jgi:hypothetical protein
MFEKIKNINLMSKESWVKNNFLTFDLDWCCDEVLNYTLDIIEKYNLKSTFFITHKTILLSRMQTNNNIELGIHPNFNHLLTGDILYGKNVNEVVQYYKNIVQSATSARSHSMTQNSLILDAFESNNIKFDCNTFIPFSSKIETKPYKHWTNNLIKIPYFWEDDIHCLYNWDWDVAQYLNYKGLNVFDFHPIHIFLNTETLDRYNIAKPYLQDYKKLCEFRNTETYGIKDFLIDLISQQ